MAVSAAARVDATERALRAWHVLERVLDPEVPVVSVVDLGIVRELTERDDGSLAVVLTPTYSGCPATEVIEQSVRVALAEAGFERVAVRLQRAPAWTTDWISAEGRRKLREYGIAPPGAAAAEQGVPIRLVRREPTLACPRCDSMNTERLSAYGSTACKALYRCRACGEPFEHFKPI
ncbi:MAG TPA: 1,2-phenylacetyl-CoA epoxidase subunit PaaD [Burkholderiaceae bacterium]|nr:1,2-phenylacetyl-CoA epoxidase subunit PaaD [Burkholderiaceae bacterium]